MDGNVKNKVVIPRTLDTYLAVLRNSPGTGMFKNAYADVDGEKKDITDNGDLSCAFFVSSVLVIFGMIKEIHITVSSTVRDMEMSGWVDTEDPGQGDVIVWSEKLGDDGKYHKHVGFFWEERKAISNSKESRYPVLHDLEMPGREVERFLTNEKLR